MLLVGASAYYSTVKPTRVDTQNTSDFNPVLYTADQLIPVVRFGQPEIWQFHGAAAAAVGVVLTVLGWTLGIAIAAGATRALTRTRTVKVLGAEEPWRYAKPRSFSSAYRASADSATDCS